MYYMKEPIREYGIVFLWREFEKKYLILIKYDHEGKLLQKVQNVEDESFIKKFPDLSPEILIFVELFTGNLLKERAEVSIKSIRTNKPGIKAPENFQEMLEVSSVDFVLIMQKLHKNIIDSLKKLGKI